MWDNRKSILLSRICIYAFMAMSFLGVIFGYELIKWFIGFSRADLQNMEMWFVLTCYGSAVFVIVTLFTLSVLLKNISKEDVFTHKNVGAIRICSWCCFAVALLCTLSTAYYAPFMIVAVGAAFVGLILRIIKNIFGKAIVIKEENELTI